MHSESPFTSFGGASDETRPCNIMDIALPQSDEKPEMLANEEPAAAVVPELAEPAAVVVPKPAEQPAATEHPEQEFTDSEEA